MRIGVVAGNPPAEEGGGFTFTRVVLEAIKTCSSRHEFIIWEELEQYDSKGRRIDLVKRVADSIGAGQLIRSTARVLRSVQTLFGPEKVPPLGQFITDSKIEVVWFLHPGYPPVSAPFLATIWDLQHRCQPFFPEVSTTGWTWEAREHAYRSSLPRAARIITGTETGKSEIVAVYGVAPKNISVIPMPVPVVDLINDNENGMNVREKYRLKGDFLFYPAQFWPHKNHVNLLLALDLIKRNAGLDLDLVLVGSDKGNLRHVQNTIAALGLSSQVHIPGFVSNADLCGLYREAICLAFVSFFGPDNIPPLEAFALGCPVIAARVPGSEEQLKDAALLFDPADPADIARIILMVYRDARLRAELVRRGREVVSARSPRSYVEQICRILDEFEPIRRCWGDQYLHP
jgi:glycosyltransferase involved in cell wall biosynthesis